ncbi:Lipase 3 [Zootermopsis nevadensis]|nr:Lipase 3 [Zootermopsis nevadensis]
MASKVIIVAICLMAAVFLTEARSAKQLTEVTKENQEKASNPDVDLTTPDLLAKYGYPAESHTVQTDDGYLLTLHRIPHGKEVAARADRPPVLLQHGLLSSSADWVVNGPGKALAYLLADQGYDVWLGNSRGNTYSRKHVSLNPSKDKFWDFSWHEMGVSDLPAVIDYIIDKTGSEQIFYAGHSMGTTMFYVLASERPEYNSKIRAHFSLAPVAFMSHLKSPLIQLASKVDDELKLLLDLMGVYEFLPHSGLLTLIGELFCNDEAITVDICSNVLFLIAGYDSSQLNRTLLPVILGHTPAGASTKSVVHYGQEVGSGKFRKYDHGLIGNLFTYGHISPPEYDLKKVTAPVFLYYSDNDWLAAVKDVDELSKKLPKSPQKIHVKLESFNHLDYLWAIDAESLVYDEVIAQINNL